MVGLRFGEDFAGLVFSKTTFQSLMVTVTDSSVAECSLEGLVCHRLSAHDCVL